VPQSLIPVDEQKLKPKDGGPSFSVANRLTRLVWGIVWCLLFAWTPNVFHPWRRFLLRLFGAQMGHRAEVRGTARVWLPSNLIMEDGALIGPGVVCYNQGVITLGRKALVSQGVHLCAGTHDADHPDFPLIAKPIYIGAQAWVAADAFVGPGTVVGEGAVLGARGVAFGRLEPWTVYMGNPAKPFRRRSNLAQDNSGQAMS
jgi:putative colanic acid biosynthesis acetyltransferase WcaF